MGKKFKYRVENTHHWWNFYTLKEAKTALKDFSHHSKHLTIVRIGKRKSPKRRSK